MIRTLRAYFLARLLREKLLLVAFAILIALTWLSGWSTRVNRFWKEQRGTGAGLKEQTLWLTNRRLIEDSATKAASHLDASRTLDGTRLLAEMTAMANETGLRNTMTGDPQEESNGQFAIHTLQFNVTKTDWESLEAFYMLVQKRSPYIGIEQFAVRADPNNPAVLNATMKVSSVEISHD
jgi:hypothetical protein